MLYSYMCYNARNSIGSCNTKVVWLTWVNCVLVCMHSSMTVDIGQSNDNSKRKKQN